MRTSLRLVVASASISLSACGPSATEGGFNSANPAAHMYAIEQAAREGDRSAIRDLIELLDSDDSAVRLLAITTLERLTGQNYGYRHYDSAMERREAIARWVSALNSGRIQPMMNQDSGSDSTRSVPAPTPQTVPDAVSQPAHHG